MQESQECLTNGAMAKTDQIITITTPGTYTVDVISPDPENCTSRKTIIVNEHLIPKISRV